MKSPKLLCTLLASIIAAASIPFSAAAYNSADWIIERNQRKAWITGYNGTDTDVICPDIVEDDYATTTIYIDEIQSSVLANKGIRSLQLPQHLSTIGMNCCTDNQITEISLPSSLSLIGRNAFRSNQLKSLDLSSLHGCTIEYGAFMSNQLTSVEYLPNTLTLEQAVFNDNLLPDSEAWFYAKNEPTKLISYGGARRDNVSIPAGTETLDEYCLASNRITSCTIPDSVVRICSWAFYENNLTEIIIPQSVTRIDSNAFSSIPSLKTIYLAGRENTDGMTLGQQWNGSASVEFLSSPPPPAEDVMQSITVAGSVEPLTVIDIDVPVQTTFLIDAKRNFKSAEFSIKSNTPVPVAVTATSLKAKKSNPTKVVSHTVHSDIEWNNLNRSETQSQIALGIQIVRDKSDLLESSPSDTQWFGNENTDSNIPLGTLSSAYGTSQPPQLTLMFDSRYGKSWGDVSSIGYDLFLTFSVV